MQHLALNAERPMYILFIGFIVFSNVFDPLLSRTYVINTHLPKSLEARACKYKESHYSPKTNDRIESAWLLAVLFISAPPPTFTELEFRQLYKHQR